MSFYLALLLTNCQSSPTQKPTTEQSTNKTDNDLYLYIGTYTTHKSYVKGKGNGIYVYKMNQETGALTYVSEIKNVAGSFFFSHTS